MAKKFISILGLGNYSSCIYTNGEENIETRFVQEAILDMYFKYDTTDVEIDIFLTKEAKEKNWINHNTVKVRGIESILKESKVSDEKINIIRESLGNSIEWKDREEEKKTIGLEEILNSKYKNAKINSIEIEKGANEDELWDTFERIYNSINEGDEIIFDITHGLRSIPMQALTILYYARVLKKIKILGVYYGAYEVRDKEKNIAPIFDLTSYYDILSWTSAVNLFVNYGNGKLILDNYKEKHTALLENKDYSLANSNLKYLVNSVKHFTDCINTSRGKIYTKNDCKDNRKRIGKSTYAAALSIKSSLDDIKKEDYNLIKPLNPLLSMIEHEVESFCLNSNEEVGVATIKWCIEKELIQQGYTAFEETLKTFVCNKYKLDETNPTIREAIVKGALNTVYKTKCKNNADDKEDKKEKYIKSLYNNDKIKEDDIEYYKKIVATVPTEIAKLLDISQLRNDISHFSFTYNSTTCDNLKVSLENGFKEFKDIREKYKNRYFC